MSGKGDIAVRFVMIASWIPADPSDNTTKASLPWDAERLSLLLSANGLKPEDGETILILESGANTDADGDAFSDADLNDLAAGAPTAAVTFLISPRFRGDMLCDALLPLVADADLILFSAGPAGDELACRMSIRSGGSSITAANSLSLGDDCLLVSRRTYAGHMTGTWQLTQKPWYVSLSRTLSQPGTAVTDTAAADTAVTGAAAADTAVSGAAAAGAAASLMPTHRQIRFHHVYQPDPLQASDRILTHQETSDNALSDADFILAAGRGVGSARGAAKAAEHADKLGASLGCSRPVVMSAWLPMDRLLGVSGSLTSPRLVIVCGASGAPAFFTGIESAETVIAINTDADAAIMNKADLAITGDWNEILTQLEQLR